MVRTKVSGQQPADICQQPCEEAKKQNLWLQSSLEMTTAPADGLLRYERPPSQNKPNDAMPKFQTHRN